MEGRRICKKCDLYLQMSEKTERYIAEFIERLPKEKRRKEDDYQNCLEQCDKCERLLEGVCNACGCYVAIRAAVEGTRCPYEKW